MKRIIVITTVALLALTACQKVPVITALDEMNTTELIWAAQYTAERAQTARGRKAKTRKKEWAQQGMSYSEKCVESSPQTPECYYWRAVNTGLYYSVKIKGYQKGIKQMLDDCKQVIALGKADYDHAGPYRIQGEIYTQLPKTTGRPDSIVRDLDKGERLLRKAVSIAPDYPENHIALARNLYEQDRYEDALNELMLAKRQSRKWRIDYSYAEWQKTIKSLTRKIERKR